MTTLVDNKKHKTGIDYDVIIIGGGMVGASLACALAAHTEKRIAVVEAVAFDNHSQPSFDDRSTALSYGSRRIWQAMGLWQVLEPLIEAINTIHVSEQGHLGAVRLYHTEENVEALGYVAENRVLGQCLMQRLNALEHIDWLSPASLQQLHQHNDRVDVTLSLAGQQRHLTCRLLVAADGAMSQVRALVGLGVHREDYGQSAIISNVTTEYAHQNVAYERFTTSGPLAFLPMTKNRSAVVWTVNTQHAPNIMALDDDAFIAQLHQRFGYRLGHILQLGSRQIYPLAYLEAEQLYRGRVVIIGNAAHTLHPVSGQGYNLALRDVAEIAELIAQADDPGKASLLHAYSEARLTDMHRVYRMTDSLVKIFSNTFLPLSHARAALLMLVDRLPGFRHLLARQSMGLLGHKTKMMRGIPL